MVSKRNVNIKKMRKRRAEESRQGGEYFTFEFGDTILYIHPPCRDNDKSEPTEGLPYISVEVHYSLGKEGTMAPSLDAEVNPIIVHPFVQKFLKTKGVKIKGSDPISRFLADADDDDAHESRRQTRFLWGVTPMKFKAAKSSEYVDLPVKPTVMLVGPQIHDGIMGLFDELEDITDPTAAILVRINKEKTGKNKQNVKYTVHAEAKTLRKPMKLDSALGKKIDEAMKVGGDCDLFRVVANMVKGTEELKAILKGVKLDDDDDEDDDDEDEDDKKSKKSKTKKSKKPADDDEDDDDSDDDDEDDDDSDDDDEDDSDDDDSDEDDDDSDDDDDEDDDDDDSDDEDEDDDEDDDDDDADDDDSDDDAEDDDEDDSEDEDDEDEDDDDEPAPKKGKGKGKSESKSDVKDKGKSKDKPKDEAKKPGRDPAKDRAKFEEAEKAKAKDKDKDKAKDKDKPTAADKELEELERELAEASSKPKKAKDKAKK